MSKTMAPDTFYGSFPISTPVQGWGSQGIKGNLLAFAGQDAISNAFFDQSYEAAIKIRDAIAVMDKCVKASNCTDVLAKDLQLCSPATATQWASIYGTAIGTYVMLPAFNYAVPNIVFASAKPLIHVVNMTLEADTPGAVLRAALLTRLLANHTACIDPANPVLGGGPQQTENTGDTFAYITCKYYPFNLNSVRPGGILPPSNGTISCPVPAWSAPDYNATAAHWNVKYNLTTKALNRVRRMVIVQGSYDSVSGIGSPNIELSADREHSRLLYVLGNPHGEDMFSLEKLRRGISPATDKVRDIKLNYIKAWLAASATGGGGNETCPRQR